MCLPSLAASTDYSIHPQMVSTYCVPGLERPSGDGDQPSCPSILPTDFPLTHSLQPPCCCLNRPGMLPPQGLCTGSALCLDHSSPNIQVAPPPDLCKVLAQMPPSQVAIPGPPSVIASPPPLPPRVPASLFSGCVAWFVGCHFPKQELNMGHGSGSMDS